MLPYSRFWRSLTPVSGQRGSLQRFAAEILDNVCDSPPDAVRATASFRVTAPTMTLGRVDHLPARGRQCTMVGTVGAVKAPWCTIVCMGDSTHTVDSADGTRIGYRLTGTGPAMVVVPGNNRMAHNYDRLAAALADGFSVCVIERRGRGNSGPQGPRYSIDREVEDLQAVADAVGARMVFGHSYGGLIALTAARSTSDIDQLVVYEPGVSINGSFDLSSVRSSGVFSRGASTSGRWHCFSMRRGWFRSRGRLTLDPPMDRVLAVGVGDGGRVWSRT